MTIKTKASLQSFFQRGDTPTSANFADMINSFILLPVNGSTISQGILDVESTASTTSYVPTNFAKNFLTNVGTTAQAQDWIAFTSASGAGGGAFGQDWLNAATTSEATDLLGPGIASNVLTSAGEILYTDGSGLQKLQVGSSGQVLTAIGSAPAWTSPALGSRAAQATTSGSAFDFTGIPSWVRRITVLFDGVSTDGADSPQVQIGDSGGIETTGYDSNSIQHLSGGAHSGNSSSTTGFNIIQSNASYLFTGQMVLTLIDSSTNTWVSTSAGFGGVHVTGAGKKSLSGTLDRVRVTRSGATSFDAGSVNILYE